MMRGTYIQYAMTPMQSLSPSTWPLQMACRPAQTTSSRALTTRLQAAKSASGQNMCVTGVHPTAMTALMKRIVVSTHAPLCITNTNKDVDIVDSYKYLGITTSKDLFFSHHITNTCFKLNQCLFFLRKLKSFNADNSLLKLLYSSIIQSDFTFCFQVFLLTVFILCTST